jgi:hypothetical protein
MTDASVKSSYYLVKRLGGDQGEALNLYLPYHVTSPVAGKTSRNDCGQNPFS